jgi:hypothetical protein
VLKLPLYWRKPQGQGHYQNKASLVCCFLEIFLYVLERRAMLTAAAHKDGTNEKRQQGSSFKAKFERPRKQIDNN